MDEKKLRKSPNGTRRAMMDTTGRGAVWNMALFLKTVREKYIDYTDQATWNLFALEKTEQVGFLTYRMMRSIEELWDDHVEGRDRKHISRFTPGFEAYALGILYPSQLTPEQRGDALIEVNRIAYALLNEQMPDTGEPVTEQRIKAYAEKWAKSRYPVVRLQYLLQPGHVDQVKLAELEAALAGTPAAAKLQEAKDVFLNGLIQTSAP